VIVAGAVVAVVGIVLAGVLLIGRASTPTGAELLPITVQAPGESAGPVPIAPSPGPGGVVPPPPADDDADDGADDDLDDGPDDLDDD
jgi:hypothetical protein